MGKINGCLKCVFIFFNVVFGICGCWLIAEIVKAQAINPQLSSAVGSALNWMLVFAIGMLLVSILGVIAAITENTLLLKVFAGLIVGGLIIMMVLGIVTAVYRNKVKEVLKNIPPDIGQHIMADSSAKEVLIKFQEMYHCCGVMSYKDWGNNIPGSCNCSEATKCTEIPQYGGRPVKIYSEPCFNTMLELVDLAYKIFMGFFFGLAVIALVCLVASLLMIRQVRRHDGGSRGQSIAMKSSGY